MKLDGGQLLLELVQILTFSSILWQLVRNWEKGILVLVHSCLDLYERGLVSLVTMIAVDTNWIEGMASKVWTMDYLVCHGDHNLQS